MNTSGKSNVIIYRYAKSGLEIFMFNDASSDGETWKLPATEISSMNRGVYDTINNLIELDNDHPESGAKYKAIAIEGDWHDLPSLMALIEDDVRNFKSKVKELVPPMNQGAYVAIKEAFKNVMPHEYALLKELKDILLDRNSLTNL